MLDRNNHTGWSLVVGLTMAAAAGLLAWLGGRGNSPRGEDQTITLFKKSDED